MDKLLCPSMMCADLKYLSTEIQALEEAGTDIFHCDVMDGTFVPNFALGLSDIASIRKSTDKLVDVHLMVENPAQKVDWFIDAGADIIYIHPEADVHTCRTLQMIKDAGASAGIAINPGTSFESVKELLYLCDYVMIMSVNPGFAGQKYLDFVTPKFKKFVEEAKNYGGYKVMIDGACSPEKIAMLSKIGVEGFILGTSALFGKDKSYQEICQELREL